MQIPEAVGSVTPVMAESRVDFPLDVSPQTTISGMSIPALHLARSAINSKSKFCCCLEKIDDIFFFFKGKTIDFNVF